MLQEENLKTRRTKKKKKDKVDVGREKSVYIVYVRRNEGGEKTREYRKKKPEI
jgi:hypothetical protein